MYGFEWNHWPSQHARSVRCCRFIRITTLTWSGFWLHGNNMVSKHHRKLALDLQQYRLKYWVRRQSASIILYTSNYIFYDFHVEYGRISYNRVMYTPWLWYASSFKLHHIRKFVEIRFEYIITTLYYVVIVRFVMILENVIGTARKFFYSNITYYYSCMNIKHSRIHWSSYYLFIFDPTIQQSYIVLSNVLYVLVHW